MTTAAELIDRLALGPHPEGGWYRETWRAPAASGERASATAILFCSRPAAGRTGTGSTPPNCGSGMPATL